MSTTTENVSRETEPTGDNVSRETSETPETGKAPETTDTAQKTTDTEQPSAGETDDTDSENDENGTDDLSKVRREAAKYRTQLRETEAERDTLRSELFRARVAATGRLADAEDMPVDPDILDDADALDAAITQLLEAKPHLKARSFGDIGHREKRQAEGVSLGSILRSNA